MVCTCRPPRVSRSQAFPKLNKAYFSLLGIVTRDHMRSIAQLDAATFACVVRCPDVPATPRRFLCGTLLEGLRSVETHLATQCCSSLDSILSFAVAGRFKARPDAAAGALDQLIAANAPLFAAMLQDLLNNVIFEECKHQWSISRPLLGLIIAFPSVFLEVRPFVARAAPDPRRSSSGSSPLSRRFGNSCLLRPSAR